MASTEVLDSEISAIRDQIASLRSQRANLTSILLSSPHLATRLEHRPVQQERLRRNAAKIVKQQTARNLENVYRACAGVTAYKVKDPDPNAVDSGNILGLRIEVSVEGKFVDTYHVLLNRPSSRNKALLRVHRHTIPPCIPVTQLAAKYLPLPRRDASKTVEQDVIRFGRILRKELVAWHLRTTAVQNLRTGAGLSDKVQGERLGDQEAAYGKVLNAFVSDDEEGEDEDADFEETRRHNRPVEITDIEADMAVRQITIAWSSGQTAVLEVAKNGEVARAVIRSQGGLRLPDLERRVAGRMEGLIERLTS
jgi:central kinetochore subunit Mal2/MCM21